MIFFRIVWTRFGTLKKEENWGGGREKTSKFAGGSLEVAFAIFDPSQQGGDSRSRAPLPAKSLPTRRIKLRPKGA